MILKSRPGNPCTGTVDLPGDKSLSHRAALLAALAEGESCIENFLVAGVTERMLHVLSALGVPWELQGHRLTVQGRGLGGLRTPAQAIDCGNSATTMRMLAGALAAAGVRAEVDGSEGLRRRPMRRVVEPLQAMGAPIEASENGTAPLRLDARPKDKPLKPIEYRLPVVSAQVKTCLLLAALAASGPTTLYEPGPSRDHTERMLGSMGVKVESGPWQAEGDPTRYTRIRITPAASGMLSPLRLTLPGDISSAAFLIVAALITPGSEVVLRGVGLNPTRTGLLDVLMEMGADLQVTAQAERGGEPVGDLRARYSRLWPVHVSGPLVVRMIDEFPAFAVAAAFAEGRSAVSEAGELRHKESDRISAMAQELRLLGADVEEMADGFTIQGREGGLHGGVVQAHGDHRLAMALAVAGLAAQGEVTVQGAEMTGESFPDFAPVLQSLGADVSLEG